MKQLLTAVQMQGVESRALDQGTLVDDLMEAAGWAVAREAVSICGGAYGSRVLIFCGKGNNGGDGLVAARLLRRWGAAPVIVFMEDPASITGAASRALQRIRFIRNFRFDPQRVAREVERADVVVDAMVGVGFKGSLRTPYSDADLLINECGRPVIAVDIASGVHADTGHVEGVAVDADVTVAMGAAKLGSYLLPGADHCGLVVVADIGLDVDVSDAVRVVEPDDVALSIKRRSSSDNKRSAGKVLVIGGSSGMLGAPTLTAMAALRSGAGYARLGVPGSIMHAATYGLEVVELPLPDGGSGHLGPPSVDHILAAAAEADVVVLGPGIGRHPEIRECVHKVAALIDRPLILDADGIVAFGGEATALTQRRSQTVLTPHAGEMSALLDISVETVNSDRIGVARMAAEVTGAAVLLKGFHTIVASPTGEVWMVTTGGPILATAGSGDVLAGLIAALATYCDPTMAAWSGAWVHGAAADAIATVRPTGMVAGDLLDAVPLVIGELLDG